LACAAAAGSLVAQARGGGTRGAPGLRSAQAVAQGPASVGRMPAPVVTPRFGFGPRPTTPAVQRAMGPRLTNAGPASRLVVPQPFTSLYSPFFWGVDAAPADVEPDYISPSVSQNEAPLSYEIQQLSPAPVESLVLENQGGQWVRISNYGQPPAHALSAQAGSGSVALQATKLPAALLVFRDGHNEEVEGYMIQGNVIFASANYWSAGSWTRKIPIAELDVSATLKLNEERGVKFRLPSEPNEVIIRP